MSETMPLQRRRVRVALVVLGLGLALQAGPARAEVYAVPIQVNTEEDLANYVEDGVIEEDDYETLKELFHNPLDINRARRLELFELPGVSSELAQAIVVNRREQGDFASVSRMARVPGMTNEILRQIEPFVEVVAKPEGRRAWQGYARLKVVQAFEPSEPLDEDDHPFLTHSVDQLGKETWPSAYLKSRVSYQKWLEAGFLGVMQDQALRAEFDEDSRDIYMKWGSPAFELGKLYASAGRGHLTGIVGSYTAGFGLGLTFDDTTRSHPLGWYPDLTVGGTESFSVKRGLFGASARLLELRSGDLSVDATLIASSRRYDIYQYDMGLAGGEDVDPLTDDLDSPRIFVEGQKVGWVTVPNAYRESIFGGNVTVGWRRSTWVGLTSYVGFLDTTALTGADDPDDWVIRGGYPDANTYGAIGLNVNQAAGPFDISGEVAQSFTGGPGALVEVIYGASWGTVEGSLRHYATDFDNPHARGVAAADEYGGMRDRDEQGVRLEAEVEPVERLQVRVWGDLWRNISTTRSNLALNGRVQVEPVDNLVLAVLADHRNRDLANNGRTREYGGEYITTEYAQDNEISGESYADAVYGADSTDVVEGAGSKSWIGGQVRFDGLPRTSLQAFYKRIYEDAGLLYPNGTELCEPWYMIGQYTWFKAVVEPVDATQLSWRIRYEDDDIYGSREDRNLETWLQVSQKLPYRMKLSARGTIGWDLTDPPAEWKDDCSRAGVPELNGTCVALGTDDEEEDLYKTDKPYGLLQASLEGRF